MFVQPSLWMCLCKLAGTNKTITGGGGGISIGYCAVDDVFALNQLLVLAEGTLDPVVDVAFAKSLLADILICMLEDLEARAELRHSHRKS